MTTIVGYKDEAGNNLVAADQRFTIGAGNLMHKSKLYVSDDGLVAAAFSGALICTNILYHNIRSEAMRAILYRLASGKDEDSLTTVSKMLFHGVDDIKIIYPDDLPLKASGLIRYGHLLLLVLNDRGIIAVPPNQIVATGAGDEVMQGALLAMQLVGKMEQKLSGLTVDLDSVVTIQQMIGVAFTVTSKINQGTSAEYSMSVWDNVKGIAHE